MYEWKCKYCKKVFHYCELCVNHEINICNKNPKFKYRTDTENK